MLCTTFHVVFKAVHNLQLNADEAQVLKKHGQDKHRKINKKRK